MSYLLWAKTLPKSQAVKTLENCQKGIEGNSVKIRRSFFRRVRTTVEKAKEEIEALPPKTEIAQGVYSPERFGHSKHIIVTEGLKMTYWFNPSKYKH